MGIYDTTANTYANSFYGPQNGAIGSSGWQVDANLATPSYSAPYRPQYAGQGPYQRTSSPGFFSSAATLVNPFASTPLFQSPGQNIDPYVNSFSYKPYDAGMSLAQNFVLPGLAMGAANKYFGANTPSTGGLWQSLKDDFMGMFQGQGRAAAFGQGFGRSAGQGLARSFGFAEGGAAARGVAGVAAGAGSFVASAAVPIMVGQAAMYASEGLLFNPYIDSRRMGNDLRSNFQGVTFAGATGNVASGGKGLGNVESGGIARSLARAGINDFTFGTEDYAEISSMSARSGLLDSSKMQDISRKVKSIAEQVKLIVQISQDPSIQNAVEELSKLHTAGASTSGGMFSQASTAFSSMGMYASAAGTTVRRLMDRVGQQGQMLYGMNGMTPYMGQMAAADIYAGFASGQRTGLISEAHLARMGGIEGATQSAMTGSINAMQTPYARMMMYNRYMGGASGGGAGGPGQSAAQVAGTFGQLFGGDPLKAMGAQLLYGNQMASKFMQDDGGMGIENMAEARLRDMGQQRNPKTGKYSGEQYAIALRGLGMSDAEVHAFIAKRISDSDPGAMAQRAAGYKSQAYDQTLAYMESNGLLNTSIAGFVHGARVVSKNVATSVYNMAVAPVSAAGDYTADYTRSAWHNAWYGSSLSLGNGASAREMFGDASGDLLSAGYKRNLSPKGLVLQDQSGNGKTITEDYTFGDNARYLKAGEQVFTAPFKGFDLPFGTLADSRKTLSTIERLALDTTHPANKLASEFMSTSDAGRKRSLLSELTRSHPSEFGDSTYGKLFHTDKQRFVTGGGPGTDYADDLIRLAGSVQTRTIDKVVNTNLKGEYASSLDKVLGSHQFTSYGSMQAISKLQSLGEAVAGKNGSPLDDTTISKYIEDSGDPMLKHMFAGKSGKESMTYLRGALNRARDEGRLLTSVVAGKIGSVSEVDRNPAAHISDPATLKRYLAARSVSEKEDILQELSIKQAGGSASEIRVAPGKDLSVEESVRSTSFSISSSMKVAEEATRASKAFDLKGVAETMEGFDKSVSRFGKIINEDLARVISGNTGDRGAIDGNLAKHDNPFLSPMLRKLGNTLGWTNP